MARERSHWAWGWADRLPDAAARRGLGAMVTGLTGWRLEEPTEAVPLDAVVLPAPRIEAPPALAPIASATREDRVHHTHGRAFRDQVRGFRGDFRSAPDVVLRPRDEDEVAAVLEWASRARVAVVPFGGGSSVVGGVEIEDPGPYNGVATLDLGRLDGVREVDVTSRAARIGAGSFGPALEAGLAPHGLTLRHFPQSFEFSTLGGWIATRAGGHFATNYTHVDDLVESLRVVTPSGLVATRRLPASGAGPQPERLFLGSEGALGIITEAWMRVVPRPRFRASASVTFREWSAAVDAVRAIAQSGLFPANCRLLDAREALLNGVVSDGGSVLVLGFESADHPLGPWIDRALALAREHGGECAEGARLREAGDAREASGDAPDDAAARWRRSFLDGPYLQGALLSLDLVADTFETACTWDRFATLHRAVIGAVKEAARPWGGALVSCRFTHVYPDGPAPYYTFLSPAGGEPLDRWARIKHAASEALVSNGATITHHHAVGRQHRPYWERERPAGYGAVLQAVKRTLDPAGILNPGALIDPA